MTRAVQQIVLLLFFVIIMSGPPAASAQDTSPQNQPADQEKERSNGLPKPIKWTFNFDAGWGTFGFANSLYINPKDPGTNENLSDQWFEGYVKPALSGHYSLASSESEFYGKISAVGEG